MTPVVFDQADPGERGRAHGEHWRREIGELAEIRLALCLEHRGFASRAEVLAVAQGHLPVLLDHDAALHAELCGIAQGAGISAAEVVVLNHYTDLRDIGGFPDDGGCTAVYFGTQDGAVLGQTWDMHASAEPYVRMIRIAPPGGPEVLVFTLTGCLGMAGLSETGVAVTINNLTTTDARVGLVWPALVRMMLGQPDALAARDVLERASLSGGHHYMIADGREFFGFECSGELKVVTQLGARAAHLHTNHCFDPVLRKSERVAVGSTTFERLNLATTLFAQQRPATVAELWALLSSHEGFPTSICAHPSGVSTSKTCGILVMQPGAGSLRAAAGCGQRGTPLELRIG